MKAIFGSLRSMTTKEVRTIKAQARYHLVTCLAGDAEKFFGESSDQCKLSSNVSTSPYLLIVDDDPEDIHLLSNAFSDKNPSVIVRHATRGDELLTYLRNCRNENLPAVLVLDYKMQGLDGPEILRLLREDARFKPILKVIWSTSQREKDIQNCMTLGAIHYFVKPSSKKELDQIIHQLKAIFDLAVRGRQ